MKSTPRRLFRRFTVLVVLSTLLTSPLVPRAAAADSTMVQVAKSTVYGGLLGLLLGAAVAIVVEDDRDEPIRWGLVLGVFGGFAYGVYAASTGRDEFFHESGGVIDPARYRLPAAATPGPAHSVVTPLRSGSEGRSEFSPFAVLTAE